MSIFREALHYGESMSLLKLTHQGKTLIFENSQKFTRKEATMLHAEFTYFDPVWQCFFSFENKKWFCTPNPKAPNETIINKNKLTQKMELKEGYLFAVGRESKQEFKSETEISFVSYPTVTFQDKKITVNKKLTISNTPFWQSFFKEEFKFISPNQHSIILEKDGWYVVPHKPVKNDSILNGSLLISKTKLKHGDHLSLGNLQKKKYVCVLVFEEYSQISTSTIIENQNSLSRAQTNESKRSIHNSSVQLPRLKKSIIELELPSLSSRPSEASAVQTLLEIQTRKEIAEEELRIIRDNRVEDNNTLQQKIFQYNDATINNLLNFHHLYEDLCTEQISNYLSNLEIVHKNASTQLSNLLREKWPYHLDQITTSQVQNLKLISNNDLPKPVLGTYTLKIGKNSFSKPHVEDYFSEGKNLILLGTSNDTYNSMMHLITQISMHCPHNVMFTLLDGKSMGRAFPMKAKLTHRQLENTETRSIISDITKDIQAIFDNYISGTNSNFFQLPKEVKADLKYEIICIANFPEGFETYDLKSLEKLCINGPIAGKFIIFQCNGTPFPDDFQINDLPNCVQVDVGLPSQDFQFIRQPLGALSDTIMDQIFQKIDELPKPSNSIPLPVLSLDEMWQGDSREYIEVSLGKLGTLRPLEIMFGQKGDHISTHGAMIGMMGMGKSNFFHAIICAIAQKYSPEEVNFYMIDGKSGMTFQYYTQLPHANIVILKSAQETSADLVKRIVQKYIKERGNLFKEAENKKGIKVEKFSEYRDLGYPLPRILLFIDEYADLFSNPKNQMDVSNDFVKLTAQARAFGVHFMLGGHSFGANGMSHKDEIFKNISLRIAMKIAEEARMELTNQFGDAGVRESKRCISPGQMIFNAHAGVSEQTYFGRAAFLPSSAREKILSNILAKCRGTSWEGKEPISFRGTEAPDFTQNQQINELLSYKGDLFHRGKLWSKTPKEEFGINFSDWNQESKPIPLWLGQELSVYGYATIILTREINSNLVILGEGAQQRFGMIAASMKSLVFTQQPDKTKVYLFNKRGENAENIPFVMTNILDKLGFDTHYYTDEIDLETILDEFLAELERRKNLSDAELIQTGSQFLYLVGADKMRRLFGIPTSYSPEPSPCGQKLIQILSTGSLYGMHVILSVRNPTGFNQILSDKQLHFEYRVTQKISSSDSIWANYELLERLVQTSDYETPAVYFSASKQEGNIFKPYEATLDQEKTSIDDFMKKISKTDSKIELL